MFADIAEEPRTPMGVTQTLVPLVGIPRRSSGVQVVYGHIAVTQTEDFEQLSSVHAPAMTVTWLSCCGRGRGVGTYTDISINRIDFKVFASTSVRNVVSYTIMHSLMAPSVQSYSHINSSHIK